MNTLQQFKIVLYNSRPHGYFPAQYFNVDHMCQLVGCEPAEYHSWVEGLSEAAKADIYMDEALLDSWLGYDIPRVNQIKFEHIHWDDIPLTTRDAIIQSITIYSTMFHPDTNVELLKARLEKNPRKSDWDKVNRTKCVTWDIYPTEDDSDNASLLLDEISRVPSNFSIKSMNVRVPLDGEIYEVAYNASHVVAYYHGDPREAINKIKPDFVVNLLVADVDYFYLTGDDYTVKMVVHEAE